MMGLRKRLWRRCGVMAKKKLIRVGELTPMHKLPTGHEPKRGPRVMRDKRARRQSRSSVKSRGWVE